MRVKRKPTVTVVGAGNLAHALVPGLRSAGYHIEEIVVRRVQARSSRLAHRAQARITNLGDARLNADVVWLCVPDGAIAAVAASLAKRKLGWEGKIVLHSSGALGSAELSALRKKGAHAASLHPMMTFVRRGTPSLKHVCFAWEGDATAVRVVRQITHDLGGQGFRISPSRKPLYHALGAFISPLIVAELAAAEKVARAAGIPVRQIRGVIGPILRRTVENYIEYGAPTALSGPLVRGDLDTVRTHLSELAKVAGARAVYLALARSALRNLPVRKRAQLTALLADSGKAGKRK